MPGPRKRNSILHDSCVIELSSCIPASSSVSSFYSTASYYSSSSSTSPSSSSSSSSPSSSSSSASAGGVRPTTRRLLVLLVAAMFLPEVVYSRRWMSPCGGSVTVESGGMEDDVVGFVDSQSEFRQSFHRLSEKTSGLKRKVRELRQLYVTYRFRDSQLVEDMERIGLRIEGMPVLEEATAASIATIEATRTIHKAFEDLAKVSVFLDQARIGETLSDNEHVSFETTIQHLEDNPEYGLYWLLCELYRMIVSSRQQINRDVVRSILAIRVVEVDSGSLRHTRDYLVLRDLEKLLDQLSVDFASLHLQQVAAAARR